MVTDFQLIKAQPEHKQVIANLMQLYIYDFTEFMDFDVQANGLFEAYPYLDNYWKETNHRFPYLILQGKHIIGFVLVRFMASEKRQYYSIAEFFVMKKYRQAYRYRYGCCKSGIGLIQRTVGSFSKRK
jgi:hypothetical protein